MTPFSKRLAALLGQLAPRVGVAAVVLIPHGAQKLFGWFGGQGLEASAQNFAFTFGLPPVLVLLAGLTEFFGGLLLAVGLFTRPVAAVLAGIEVFSVAVMDWRMGLSSLPAVLLPLLWGAVCLMIAWRGGGRYSVDAIIDGGF